MNQSQKENKKERRKKAAFLTMTFFVALAGSYFSQIYLKDILGRQKGETEKLSFYTEDSGWNEENIYTREDMLENVMKSVVGISKLQANEESVFDVALSQKWGMRNRSDCF